MRKVTGGNGTDTTASVKAWLQAGSEFRLANLYLIGEVEDPMALWLTDYESPLAWPIWGTFQPTVIKRGSVTSKIGLDVSSLEVTWSPQPVPFTQSVASASPYTNRHQFEYIDSRGAEWKSERRISG